MPCSTISLVPPGASKAKTGVPTAQLSKRALGNPSANEP